ncbi:MAG TPA: hypothetical protein DC034_06185 [Clostridium sp.]|jgi:hypothetical protein|nr:hypothetical protein [Clostridium sp.]
MKKNVKIAFCLLLCVLSFQYYVKAYGNTLGNLNFSRSITAVEKKNDLFKDILDETHGVPRECNLMVIFSTDKPGEKTVDGIFQKLLKYGDFKGKYLNNNKTYSVEFNGGDISGYIESVQYEGHNIITVNILEKSVNYNLPHLKNTITECLPGGEGKYRYYQYVKARIQSGRTAAVNEKIESVLKCMGTSDIKTVLIDHGYSSTANTHMFDPIQSGGNLVDFNYSVVKYPSGIYIIMGTPEIMTTY